LLAVLPQDLPLALFDDPAALSLGELLERGPDQRGTGPAPGLASRQLVEKLQGRIINRYSNSFHIAII
jgi:hypothetical protein